MRKSRNGQSGLFAAITKFTVLAMCFATVFALVLTAGVLDVDTSANVAEAAPNGGGGTAAIDLAGASPENNATIQTNMHAGSRAQFSVTYDLSNMDKAEEIFEKQLEKCQVDHFDFYLFHNVCEMNIDAYLDPSHHIHEYLMKQKENGRIRHLGFSAHGDLDTMKRFLEAYGKDMEFCQIQLNYFDWDFQDAKSKVELLADYGIPVWVMEPLRGGKLAKLDEEYEARLRTLRPDETTPALGFRFLQSIPEVTMILSGMSNMEQLKDNIATFSEDKPLNEDERKVLLDIAGEMSGKGTIPCTACHYCVSHCPQGLNIPMLISLYNEDIVTGGGFIAPMRIGRLPEDKRPGSCIGCRSCEAVCPQQIKVSEIMSEFSEKLASRL